MKTFNKSKLLYVGFALIFGIILGGLFFGDSDDDSKRHHHSENEEQTTEWTCSMHPQIRKNEPGDCPICGMDLIPLQESNTDLDPETIHMSPRALELAQVQTQKITRSKVYKEIRLNGKVQADERRIYTQASHIPGRIERLVLNFEGEAVQKGQVIAYIYSPELIKAQKELFEARKLAKTQPELFKAAQAKLSNWKLNAAQIQKILNADQPIEEFPVLANVSGYVDTKLVQLGDYIQKGQSLYRIADLSQLWLLWDVYETDLAWLNQGDSLQYEIASLAGRKFKASISYIDPVIDPKTRVAQARVEQSNTEGLLKPEMFATAWLKARDPQLDSALVLPKTAVMWTGERSVVYVMYKSDNGLDFKMREVLLGPDLGSSYVLKSGLEPGEVIAVNGTFSIDAAAQLAGKASMMNPAAAEDHQGHNHAGMEMAEKASNSQEKIQVDKSSNQAIQGLMEGYFKLKDALVADDFNAAEKSIETLSKRLRATKMSYFKGDAHQLWMQESAAMNKGLQSMANSQDLDEMREHFIRVSEAAVQLATRFPPLQSSWYIQHCPMANSNKGADWLSKSEEIRNPYFGSAMLTCGEISQSLKL
ncbi:efflux RND transporter periplasmic adaptor subunit [Croceimicrobium hydrocarbonivorans]|uniref:Efflux RND transporter periplasmic adaptor subunit n=1 Tax=Croceimicrobium hydrocarbonivorans TaxID=2761580 RepID=A0A7H0VES3_9FLAO|nr:efflux RND transporter periplasmic adaptor subunit [Croceimicrobium hydrocarbonivorans]QNR24221.1 efflux RND transporter periplasmic adaptor subunit [Croceimicrobium hydrocarbonivorans]